MNKFSAPGFTWLASVAGTDPVARLSLNPFMLRHDSPGACEVAQDVLGITSSLFLLTSLSWRYEPCFEGDIL